MGSGTKPPEASEIIKNVVKKPMETCKLLKTFTNYERDFIEKAKF